MTVISGVYNRPDGEIVPGAVIIFTQMGNTIDSFTCLTSEVITGSDGSYSIQLYDGMYRVEAQYPNRVRHYLGTIVITATSEDGTLNDYLLLTSHLPTNALIDAMQQLYFAMKQLADVPVKAVDHLTDIPADASGFYYVIDDEDKGAPTMYSFTNGSRVWLATVDDTP